MLDFFLNCIMLLESSWNWVSDYSYVSLKDDKSMIDKKQNVENVEFVH
jgi:hypothetical protein